jgi:hypothetical protein
MSISIRAIATVAVTLLASQSFAAISVLHTWNLDGGSAGGAATDPAADSTGSIHLTKVGAFNHVNTTNAGLGVDFANAGGNLSVVASNYYQNTTDTVTLASTTNWGVEAWVNLNALPAIAGDVHGETSLIEVGSGGGRMILQTFNSVLGGGGTPNWMIHIPGSSLLLADTTQGGALVAAQEQHIAAVMNGGTWELYIDGTQVPLIAAVGSLGAAPTPAAGVRLGAAEHAGEVRRGLDGVVGVARIFEFQPGEFRINDTLVPEPSGILLSALGVVSFVVAMRRRSK